MSQLCLFCGLTIKSWPIWFLSKDPAVLKGKINRTESNDSNISNFAVLSYILILMFSCSHHNGCSQQQLFVLLGAPCFVDDPVNAARAGWCVFFILFYFFPPLLTCSSPDVAFHVPPWRSACGPGPGAPSRDTLAANQDKGRAMNHSGESHGHRRLTIH